MLSIIYCSINWPNLLHDAKVLSQAGVFALVLEKIPAQLARKVTASIPVPTIGIGAGPHCDGQVLVVYDMLGMTEEFRPRFVRRYAELASTAREAFRQYTEDNNHGHTILIEIEAVSGLGGLVRAIAEIVIYLFNQLIILFKLINEYF